MSCDDSIHIKGDNILTHHVTTLRDHMTSCDSQEGSM